jgi:hypothetical protein
LVWDAGGGVLVDGDGHLNLAFDVSGRRVDHIESLIWDDSASLGVVVWRSGTRTFTSRISQGHDRETRAGYPGVLTGPAGVDLYAGNYCRWTDDGEASHAPCLPVLYDARQGTVHVVDEPLLFVDHFDSGQIVGTVSTLVATR